MLTIIVVGSEDILREFTDENSYLIRRCHTSKEVIQYCKISNIDGLLIEESRDWKEIVHIVQKHSYSQQPKFFLIGEKQPDNKALLEMGRFGIFNYYSKSQLAKNIRMDVNHIKNQKTYETGLIYCSKKPSINEDRFYKDISRVAQSDANILLLGETGSGKGHTARMIHQLSSRSNFPFLPINCASIPESLFESELFGSTKGAFTDSYNRIGIMEKAGHGTLFLDEIGELSLKMQAKLLSVVEDKEFRRIGSNQFIPLKARILTASNRMLKKEVKKGNFREDLFYRINILHLKIPSLRQRKNIIPKLSYSLLEKMGSSKKISYNAMEKLLGYQWPGNIRQLQTTLIRADSLSGKNQWIESIHIHFDY